MPGGGAGDAPAGRERAAAIGAKADSLRLEETPGGGGRAPPVAVGQPAAWAAELPWVRFGIASKEFGVTGWACGDGAPKAPLPSTGEPPLPAVGAQMLGKDGCVAALANGEGKPASRPLTGTAIGGAAPPEESSRCRRSPAAGGSAAFAPGEAAKTACGDLHDKCLNQSKALELDPIAKVHSPSRSEVCRTVARVDNLFAIQLVILIRGVVVHVELGCSRDAHSPVDWIVLGRFVEHFFIFFDAFGRRRCRRGRRRDGPLVLTVTMRA